MHRTAPRRLALLALLGTAGCFDPQTPLIVTATNDGSEADSGATVDPDGGGTADASGTTGTNGGTEPDGSGGPSTTTADETSADTTGSSERVEEVRFVHGSAGLGSVDVYVAGADSPVATGVAYGEATSFANLDVHDVSFVLRVAGTAADSAPLYTSEVLDVDADVRSAIVIAGVEGGDATEALRMMPVALPDEPITAGTARVRFIHAGADAPTLDIDVGADGIVESEGVGRFQASESVGLEVAAGETLTLGLRADGAALTQFTLPPLVEGSVALVAVTGLAGVLPRDDAGLAVIPVVTDGALPRVLQDPRVYAMNGRYVGFVPEWDVCEGATLLADGLTWTVATSMKSFQISPGVHELLLRHGDDDCIGFDLEGYSSGPLEAGEQYLAVFGLDADGDEQMVVGKEEFSTDLAPNTAIWWLNAAARSFFGLGFLVPGGGVDLWFGYPEGEAVGEVSAEPGREVWGLTIDQSGPVHDPYGTVTLQIGTGEKLWFVMAGNANSINPASSTSLRLRIVNVAPYPEPWSVDDFVFAPAI